MAYAVIQIGGPVYGVGKTLEDAINDSAQWLDGEINLDDISDYNDAQMNDICTIECSDEFLDHTATYGGDFAYDIINHMAVLIHEEA